MQAGDNSEINTLEQGLRSGFIDAAIESADDARPQLIYNAKESGNNLLSVIKRQFEHCSSFDLCVAFVADSGLQPLVEILADLHRRGIRGRFLTSTYLNFNSPSAFRKLLEYPNIEVRVYQGSMHAKGYLFERDGISTVIVGSSNLTQSALTCNREWNVLFRSYERGGVLRTIRDEFESLWNDDNTVRLSREWIDTYEAYRGQVSSSARRPSFAYESHGYAEFDSGIRPNTMQEQALEALAVLHEKKTPRALLVSATGTGKTYLSAFDVAAVKPKSVLFLVHRKRILEASLKSYRKVLGGRYTYGLYETGGDYSQVTCLFAMCSTLYRHLDEFDPDTFDYIVIDEAHRTGAGSYQKITSYFQPKFYLGMTATPNRTQDDYDVFKLFNYVIAYQITLQDALANDMLVPFHYFGIADLAIEHEQQDSVELFARLTSDERVRHIVEKIEEYSVEKEHRKGLVFCSRNREATLLSEKFNLLGYRTKAVTGSVNDDERNKAISMLESGELEYIFTVDIFNEGIDIPSVNQIIMLRSTESAIVFVQQLGRGLRKDNDKDYTLVLDFIGNYQKNYLVPVAISGDRTYNKDKLRRIVREGSTVIPGSSTVSFDKVSEARIYRAIDGGKFMASRFLRDEYVSLRRMLDGIPTLLDFDRNQSIDPMLILKKYGSYHEFLLKNEDAYSVSFSAQQRSILKFISQKFAAGKRAEELMLLRSLVKETAESSGARDHVTSIKACSASVYSVLSCGFYGRSAKGLIPLITGYDDAVCLSKEFASALQQREFKKEVVEVLDFGLSRYESSFRHTYRDTEFVLNAKYTYEEVCWLLGWKTVVNGQNIGGYKYDKDTNTYPVFINYDKDPSISDSIKYEDRFISDRELIALSKQPRSLTSPEICRLKAWPGNGMRVYLFMRKNKEDGESKEFYFLGEMEPTGAFNEIVMPRVNKTAVEITYRLSTPVKADLYEFLTSDLDESGDESS